MEMTDEGVATLGNTPKLLMRLKQELTTTNKYLFINLEEESDSESDEGTSLNQTKRSDDCYEHLTMGLVKILRKVPRVINVECIKRPPCEMSQIFDWEQVNGVYLPEDVKKFYFSTDGYILRWSYQYGPEDIRRVGKIQFPHLAQIASICDVIETNPHHNTFRKMANNISTTVVKLDETGDVQSIITTDINSFEDGFGNPLPILTPNIKIFELKTIEDQAKVCMIYEKLGISNPKFYLLELKTFKLHFLAETFREYLRMAIVHFGLPCWELLFSNLQMPPWAEQLFMLLAPHLLDRRDQRRNRSILPMISEP